MPKWLAHSIRTALLLCVAFFAAVRANANDVKNIHPTGYVTDLAGILGSQKKATLEALCTELEQKTGAQMAIITVSSLDGREVEEYAVDLFKQLGVGSKKDNRGVLLLIAPNDRKYRIEVGYGLEPVINDARAGDAGRAMVPDLRRGDYGSAAETGAWQLARYIADDAHVTLSGQPPLRHVRHPAGSGNPAFWITSGIGLLFALIPILVVISIIGRIFGGRGGGRGGASGGSGLAWFLLGMLADSATRSRGGSGWGGGGGFGGGSGGWGGGGGDFGGFGGGSSGGGGASGSW